MTGVKLVEMEYNRERSLCCGANPWAYCNSVNRQVQGQRLAQAKAVAAEILVTACPKCQIHLKCAQKSEDSQVAQIEIQDLASLVADCLTGKSGGEQLVDEGIRIGVFVCDCGLNIAGSVDTEEVRKYAEKLPGVVVSVRNRYTCSDPGQQKSRSISAKTRSTA